MKIKTMLAAAEDLVCLADTCLQSLREIEEMRLEELGYIVEVKPDNDDLLQVSFDGVVVAEMVCDSDYGIMMGKALEAAGLPPIDTDNTVYNRRDCTFDLVYMD